MVVGHVDVVVARIKGCWVPVSLSLSMYTACRVVWCFAVIEKLFSPPLSSPLVVVPVPSRRGRILPTAVGVF